MKATYRPSAEIAVAKASEVSEGEQTPEADEDATDEIIVAETASEKTNPAA